MNGSVVLSARSRTTLARCRLNSASNIDDLQLQLFDGFILAEWCSGQTGTCVGHVDNHENAVASLRPNARFQGL